MRAEAPAGGASCALSRASSERTEVLMKDAIDYSARVDALSEEMSRTGYEVFVTTKGPDIQYLTGLEYAVGYMMFAPKGLPVVFIDEARWNGAVWQEPRAELRKLRSGEDYVADVVGLWKARGARMVASESVPTRLVREVEAIGGPASISVADPLAKIRREKDCVEKELLERAARVADGAVEVAGEHIREGVSELEVAGEIDRYIKREGGDGTWFDTVVSSGIRAAHPVYPATRKVIERGDLVVVDIGVRLSGYCADITRTFALGSENGRAIEILAAVIEVQKQCVALVRAGVGVGDLASESRRAFESRGYGGYVTHALGHGIGLGKEPPMLAEGNSSRLVENECVTIEPGLYVVGFGGARIEDDVFVLKEGTEVITHSPKDLGALVLK